MSLIPFDRWTAGVVLLLTTYLMYAFTGFIVEDTLPQVAADHGTTQYGIEIINNLTGNFWWGVLMFMGAGLLLIIVAGIPGQQEETKYDY